MPAHISVIATGGTIDSLGRSRLDLVRYPEAKTRLEPGELAAAVPEVAEFATLSDVPFPRRSSYALSTDDWLALARAVDDQLRRPTTDGVVITHGTNTLEETAYFLQLVGRTPKPVVVVGAMRPANGLGTDAYLNFLRAVQVAAAPAAAGRGVLVVMNDTIFTARDVTKTSTLRVNSFAAPATGPIGYADADGSVRFHRSPDAASTVFPGAFAHIEALPRVDLVVSYVGADGALIDACVAAGARGIVSAGTGNGLPTEAESEAFDRAIAAGVVVCQSTRVDSGRVIPLPAMSTRGVVTAHDLRPWKARIALALALTRSSDPAAVQALLDQC